MWPSRRSSARGSTPPIWSTTNGTRRAEVADEVAAGWRRLLNDPDGDIALGQNTHELVTRLLSAVLGGAGRSHRSRRWRLVTTDGEFHTIRRQLDRLAEEGVAGRPG